MKKSDIFNGNINPTMKGLTVYTLVFPSIVMLACGLLFLFAALFYEKCEYAARIFLFVFSGLCLAFAIFYPLITLLLIRCYPKYPRLTKLFIKEYVFDDPSHFYKNSER